MDDLMALFLGVPDEEGKGGKETKHGPMEGMPAEEALKAIKAIIDDYFKDEEKPEDKGDTEPGPEADIKETEE